MTITVPIPTKLSLNKIYGGIHYHTRRRHRDEFTEAVWAMQPDTYAGPFPAQVTYHFHLKGKRLDSTNCGYMAKLIEDGLVHCQVLPDDSPKYIRQSTFITDSGDNEVEVTIEPCEPS